MGLEAEHARSVSAMPSLIANAFTGDLEEREEDVATGDSSLPEGFISKGPLHFPFCRKVWNSEFVLFKKSRLIFPSKQVSLQLFLLGENTSL